jgi:arylsulfatase A-like enzyme
MIQRRRFFPLAAAAPMAFGQQPRRRPNIVVILADDQGWGDLSVHGNSNLSTPNIDSLARDGALFERFFVCSVCAPTRAEFLTGRYHPRGGVRGVTTGAERLNLDETTIAETFRDAGYRTAAFGKWHNGSQHPYHPNARGFQEYYGFTSGHWGQYFDPELDHNGRLTRGKGFIIDDLTDHAIGFLEQNRGNPFFCYVPLNTPHSPMQVPDRFYEKFKNYTPKQTARNPTQEDIGHTRAALAMCENIDWNVGRILAALDRLRLAEDTIVLYFSDNGPNGWRWNGGMKGRKGSLDEGGLRAPCFFRWKGRIPAGRRVPQIAGAIDLLPTFADLAGVPLTGKKPLDGRSLKPLLLGEGADWAPRRIFTMHNRRVTVRTQQYRLDPAGALYDMEADPMQDRDISAERPAAAAELRAAAAAWAKEMLPLVGPDDRPFPAGYWENTMLPARDGVPHGGVKRSAQAPNCSYFTNWTSKDDSMTWDVEVGRPGKYEASVYYTCPAADKGSTIELSFDGARTQAKVEPPHDPPLIGKADDRHDRGPESYVKDFRPLSLGTIQLNKTRALLTLRALEIPGSQVADIRYVALKYLR